MTKCVYCGHSDASHQPGDTCAVCGKCLTQYHQTEAEDSLIADKSPDAIECVCFQCNPNPDPVRDQEALFYCPECDRSYEDGVFL